MCGFVGFIEYGNYSADLDQIVHKMNSELAHRGPDGQGVWDHQNLAFGHRRLSIVDLSPAGAQPMNSHNERYTITYNGEIYNYQKIKEELIKDGHSEFRGNSDTEVLLEAVSSWGLDKTLPKLNGMFAFALFDKKDKTLTLARDRAGEKPLYYGTLNSTFFFGSELKALKAHPAFEKNIDQDALASFFKYNCIPAPLTIYRGIKKLRPGHTLTISTQDGGQQKENEYWSLDQCIDKSKQEPITNYLDAQRLFEETMDQVLAEQMAMDVPYGAFLSGGIDSSLIVALMQKRSQTAIKTYTIGFEQPEYNEAVYAKEVAAHLKTHHTELYVSSKDCLEVIPNLPTIYDEPFSDSSQIPTFLVSNMTRNHVTVALSGDGGDEVFGGYNRHFLVPQILGKTKFLPQHLSQILGGSIKQFSPQGWNRLGRVLKLGHSAFGDKIYKMADVLESNDLSEIYSKLTGHWDSDLVINSNQGQMGELCFNSVHTASEKLMVADFLNYLPNDILTKVDRAAMSVSLETRIPFLDRRIIELAWRMPLEHKIKNGVGKRILRDVLQKYVPTSLTDRPKTGFGIPLDSWLRHDLKDWAESLISKKKITEQGHLSYPMIKAAWDDHQSGASNKQFHLWDVLMFQSWLEGQ